MSNEVTNKIELMLERTRERARQAENRFDMAAESIQRMASHSIDLFSGSAVSQVSNIAAESRKACDDLYASYQSLVVSLDEYCRPLLAEKPDASTVKKVAELMRWLNDESEIENNFTASLNGSSLGGVASGRYFASVECKMIQRYWEDKYRDMPEVAEMEAKKRELEELRRAQMEQKRKDQEKASLERYEKEKEQYNEALSQWKKETNDIKKRRQEEISSKQKEVAQKSKLMMEKTETEHKKRIDELEKQEKTYKETIKEVETEINSLGFFAIKKKSVCKRRLQEALLQLKKLSELIENENRVYEENKKEDNKKVKKMEKAIEPEIEKKYPLPAKPIAPREPRESSSMRSSSITAVQLANEGIKNEIIEFLSDGEMYTIPQMQENSFSLGELTNQRVSALVRQLITEGKVERIESNRKAYFRLI